MKKANSKIILISISFVLLTFLFIGCSSSTPPIDIYELRDIGPAGGYIFYDKGNYSDGWRYLEAAPESTEWNGVKWGGYGTYLGTQYEIGTGQSNTNIIVNWLNSHSETGCAAQLCDSLTYGGYSDWFMPSYDELRQMYENLELFGLGGFVFGYYLSSTDGSKDIALGIVFPSGAMSGSNKNSKTDILRVRAIRKF
jgi:hypothetical protein